MDCIQNETNCPEMKQKYANTEAVSNRTSRRYAPWHIFGT